MSAGDRSCLEEAPHGGNKPEREEANRERAESEDGDQRLDKESISGKERKGRRCEKEDRAKPSAEKDPGAEATPRSAAGERPLLSAARERIHQTAMQTARLAPRMISVMDQGMTGIIESPRRRGR